MGVYLSCRDSNPTYEIIIGEEDNGIIRGESYRMFCIRTETGMEANEEIRSLSGLRGTGRFTERYPKISIFEIFKLDGGSVYFVQRYVDDAHVRKSNFFDNSKDDYIELSEHDIRQIPLALSDFLISESKSSLHDVERNLIIDFLLERTAKNASLEMSLSMLESL